MEKSTKIKKIKKKNNKILNLNKVIEELETEDIIVDIKYYDDKEWKILKLNHLPYEPFKADKNI